MNSLRAPLLLLVVAFFAQGTDSRAQPRVPWTTSAVVGSPQPPRAFVPERIWPQLTFNEALDLAVVPGTDRMLVVERRGKIFSFSTQAAGGEPDLVVDLRALEPRLDNAYGVVLHPRFRETRQIFVCYALPNGEPDGTRVSRFELSSLDPLRADPKTEAVIITWRSGGHNGGNLHFGADGFLYISTGDAGPAAPPDPLNTGQDASDLLASILRIDVDQRDAGRNFRVPPDNPWFTPTPAPPLSTGQSQGPTVRPELWAFGLRNPWKMSFDRATGNLWCGDVGWELWEMIHLIRRGANYGWSAFEASQGVKVQLASPLAAITPPVVAHAHSEAASMTGGYVYRGKQLPELVGAYVYADYATGKIWALWHDGNQISRHEEIADTVHSIVTFGQGDDGELCYIHFGTPSTFHRLVRNPQATQPRAFPRTLGATGVFSDVGRGTPAPGVYPFQILTPLWSDGAVAARYIGLPGSAKVATNATTRRDRRGNEIKEYTTKWPQGAVLARTLTLGDLAVTPADRAKRIETQLLHYDGEAWNGYSYRWNSEGTDAELVPAEGAEVTISVAADPQALGPKIREHTWRFHSRAECIRCHNARTDGPLAFTPFQLRELPGAQRKELIDQVLVDAAFFEQGRGNVEPASELTQRARALLHVNCAHCHSPHAGGSVPLFLGAELPSRQMNLIGATPTQGGLGLPEPKLVDPGEPWNSVIALRMAKTGAGHMPLIGARQVDVAGVKTIEDWIASLPAEKATDAVAAHPWDEARIRRALESVRGAMQLRRTIDDGRLDASQRAVAYGIAWAAPESTVRDLFERFKSDDQRERTLGVAIDLEEVLSRTGDVVRGAKLTAADGKLVSCQACHVIQGQGRHFGPDLSRVGGQQNVRQLLESIVTPSRTIAPEFRTTLLELRDGTSLVGFVKRRDERQLLVTTPQGHSITVSIAEVGSEKTIAASMMPEGLLQGLTAQDAADLLAYLASLM